MYGATLHAVHDVDELNRALSRLEGFVLTHSQPPANLVVPAGMPLVSIAHMPVHDRDHRGYLLAQRVFGVSGYVVATLKAKGIDRAHDEPWYGVAEMNRGAGDTPIVRNSRFTWDQQKVRDRLLGLLEPGYRRWLTPAPYATVTGLRLGIVSRIAPTKHFEKLFRIIAPILADHPEVRLDIFGAGGYRSVRDLETSLRPLRDRVRWWGHQANVVPAYTAIDYLILGYPEQEALGLNTIEAMMANRAPLAIDLPPFNELIEHGKSGFLYADPRRDGGAGFAELVSTLLDRPHPLRPLDEHPETLAPFTRDAFRQRVARGLADLG
ncbi:MAG: glycosyltransferase family 4 protein [Zoogloeaceae bacterium]|nr:glycosyltransferase family 4 protein [Zoogloeaceae bacterium]